MLDPRYSFLAGRVVEDCSLRPAALEVLSVRPLMIYLFFWANLWLGRAVRTSSHRNISLRISVTGSVALALVVRDCLMLCRLRYMRLLHQQLLTSLFITSFIPFNNFPQHRRRLPPFRTLRLCVVAFFHLLDIPLLFQCRLRIRRMHQERDGENMLLLLRQIHYLQWDHTSLLSLHLPKEV